MIALYLIIGLLTLGNVQQTSVNLIVTSELSKTIKNIKVVGRLGDSMVTFLNVENGTNPFIYEFSDFKDGMYQLSIGVLDSLTGVLSYDGNEIYFENNCSYSVSLRKNALGRTITLVKSNSGIDSVFQRFYDGFISIHHKRFELEEELVDANINGLSKEQKVIGEELKAIPKQVRTYIREFIIDHKDNPAAAYILDHYMVNSDNEILAMYERLTTDVKEHSLGLALRKRRIRPILSANKYDLKMILPEISGVDESYVDRTVNHYKGKITLLLFWADYCIPCREEHPELIKIYSAYKNLGFQIVSYSIRRDDLSWKKAIKQDNIFWPQLRANSKEHEEFIKGLGVESIPSTFLLDSDGKILAKNLTLKELVSILKKKL